jgi:hypothetical protein
MLKKNVKLELYWKNIESRKKPIFLRKIRLIKKSYLYKIIKSGANNSLMKIVSNLYKGDFYIIKKVIKKKDIDYLKIKLVKYSKINKSTFYKMYEGCPNFWRRQDESIARKYSFKAVRDSFYFFRWNKENFGIWRIFNKIWRHLKYLEGLDPYKYEKNTPKDLTIDRIMVVKYPENTGLAEPHVHSTINQKFGISVYFSKLGKDYSSGGTYFFIKKGKKFNVEKKIDIGDTGIFYNSVIHGVDPVKIDRNLKNVKKDLRGRWWCGLYSPDSDCKKNRKTSKSIN